MTTKPAVGADRAQRGTHYLQDILLGILPILFGVQFLGWLTFFPDALRGHSDFRQLYIAGYMIRTGHGGELYDYQAQTALQNELVSPDELALPFVRPAYQALLFVPFSFLRYRSAYLAFLAMNLVLLGISYWLLQSRMENLADVWRGLPAALFLVFYPVALGLMQGQDSIMLVTLLAAALVALGQESELAAGTLLGLGLFKLQIVLPIALLFLLWRRWRLFAGFALSASFVTAISLWVAGLTQTAGFVRVLLSVGTGVASATGQIRFPLRVTLMANLRGLISGMAGHHLPAAWIQAVTVIASLVVMLWVGVAVRGRPKGSDALILAITTSVVVSYYLFIHDLSVMLIPIVQTLDRFLKAEAAGDRLGVFASAGAALLLVAPMCVFLIPGHFYLVSLPLCGFLLALMRTILRNGNQGNRERPGAG